MSGFPGHMEGRDTEGALERWASALQWATTRLAYRTFPRVATAALEMTAAGLPSPKFPHIFSLNLREIPPSLNEDLLDLYGRSERVLANHFSFLHSSERFDEEIHWELHESPAWRNELHAFDFALDIALTYRISREDHYARHLRYLIADWIASNPPGEGSGWLVMPLARRVRNWILAADLARDDWERDSKFFPVVSRSLSLQSAYLLRHAPSIRFAPHALTSARALLLAAKTFEGNRGEDFRAAGLAMLRRELTHHVRSDGGYVNPHPASQLRLAETVMECLVLHSDSAEGPGDFPKEKLCQILNFLEGLLLADGILPMFGADAGQRADALSDLFALAAVVFTEPRWKNLAGKFGILPYMLLGEDGKARFERLTAGAWEARPSRFSASGLYRLVAPGCSTLVVNGHSPSFPDDHRDHLSYELSMQGQRVIVDSGAYSPEGESWGEFFSSARAHNVILVDGHEARGKFPAAKRPPEEVWESGDGFQALRLDDPGFEFLRLGHRRAWYCLDGGAWVVADRLEGAGLHRVTNLLHLYPTFEVELASDRAIARSRASSFTIIPLGKPPLKTTVTRGHHPQFPGWYAPDFGARYPAGVVAIESADLPLPWVGGYLIVAGPEANFRAGPSDGAAGTISFELSGKPWRLSAG